MHENITVVYTHAITFIINIVVFLLQITDSILKLNRRLF